MSLAYFDCFAGAAGDMIVGALLDAGADFAALQAALASLGVADYSLRCEKVNRGGISGEKFHVDITGHDHAHRHLADILAIIDGGKLAPRAADRAKRVFTRLAEAEAKVHRVSVEEIHFHEVGAIDSIMDIVGACVAMELLGIDRIICSPVPLGNGTVQCEHGLLPVPAPATAELMRGAKIAPSDVQAEMTTPTAAAIMATLAEGFTAMPAMAVSAVGYGAGSRNDGPVPNLLRVFVGQADGGAVDTVVELSANIDDSTGEVLGAAIEGLLACGCLDAWAAPIVMKKSRPAWMVSALCFERDVQAVERLLFTETTTFGIRRRVCTRSKLHRCWETVETPYGPVRVKIGQLGTETVTASPEFSDCAKAAAAHHVAVREVMAEAMTIFRKEE